MNCKHFPLMILWQLLTGGMATMFDIVKTVMAAQM